MLKSCYKIPKMDCAAEESLIRLKLEQFSEIQKLEFNLEERLLNVFHSTKTELISKSLSELNLGSVLVSNIEHDEKIEQEQNEINKKYLGLVLAINFSFFIIEFITGFISDSMGLVGDSLDMLSDSFVYGISFWVVGKSFLYKKNVARLTGYSQLILSLLGYLEVVRRFIVSETIPDYTIMIIVSIFALSANILSLYILLKSKSKEVHMKATMICTSNDIIVNAGVIVAAILVLILNSPLPDLVIGIIIFSMVLRGSIRILSLK